MENTLNISESESHFAGSGGSLLLRSVQPAGAWALLGIVHGYGDHSGRHLHVMRWLAARGVACHALDLRGQGHSEGRRAYVRRWEEYLEDVDAFLSLSQLKDGPPLFLLGHSHGGLVVAAALERGVPSVAGSVLTSPYFAPRMVVPRRKVWLARALDPVLPWFRVRSGLGDDMMTSDAQMEAESKLDPMITHVATPRWYLGSLAAQQRVLAGAKQFRTPLLLLFGGADPIADQAVAQTFFDAAGASDKTFKLYPGLLHEILRETKRVEVFSDILTWLRQRVQS